MEDGVYVGPNASLRGDFGRIIIKKNANIQDGCILHGYTGMDTIVEERGHIGHGAILHSCHIKQNTLIGINAVILDGAIVGANSIIGASSVVLTGMTIPDNSLAMGIPAQIKRTLTDEEVHWKTKGTEHYIALAQRSLVSLKKCMPLTEATKTREELRFDVNAKPKKYATKK
ncbi:MAG: phenylacetic acid degradation protein PaaY [Bacteroidia bacterium]|nr:MAG: phenylacetic acid degradation protein PaaY [Bacteroidia bacterium]